MSLVVPTFIRVKVVKCIASDVLGYADNDFDFRDDILKYGRDKKSGREKKR